MKINMGNWDKVIRILLAIVAIYLYVGGIVSGALGIVLMVLAGVLLFTSFIGFCPLYVVFGVSTCQTKRSN